MSNQNNVNVELSEKLVFFVNGKKIEDSNVDPEWTLLYYLRRKLRLCGTKLGCGEGGCGACTVMVSKYDRYNNRDIHFPVNACLYPVCSMHGMSVTTTEGIGSTRTRLHPVQERIAKAHGSQCGFCTPGIVMSMYTLLRQNYKPKMDDMEEAFQGNLCRCTGYRPIIEGYQTFTEEWEIARNRDSTNTNGVCKMGKECCQLQNGESKQEATDETLFKSAEFAPYHPSQEPIFPPELKLVDTYDKQYLKFQGPSVTWYRPTTFQELLNLKFRHPEARIVVGNTEVGVETKFKNIINPVLIQPTQIAELTGITETAEGVRIGASVSLTDIKEFLNDQILHKSEEKTRIFKAFNKMLYFFAGKQIRSVGSLGGNILTGSPISDLVPILMACRAQLETRSKEKGARILHLDNTFFPGYRKTLIDNTEVLVSILLPFSDKNHYFEAYKQARRRDDDIAIVNMAVSVIIEENSNLIKDICFGIGGMSYKTVDAPKTQKNLKGLPWTQSTLEIAYPLLLEDLPLDPEAPGGMVRYRQTLALSLFLKAFLAISENLSPTITQGVCLDQRELSGAGGFKNFEYKSSQYFKVVPGSQQKEDSVQRTMIHTSAYKQASGEAVYIDDMTYFENELYLTFILSTKAHANIVSLDTEAALNIKGVVGFLSDKDLTEAQNRIGLIVPGEENIFYSQKVTSVGQIIGAVVAENQIIAQKAAKAVNVVYEELNPIIVTMEDAIQKNSFYEENENSDHPWKYQFIKNGGISMVYGNVDDSLKNATHKVKGTCKTGNQKHFYLETQTVLCVPKEDGGMDIFSATQSPMDLTKYASKLLEVPINKVSVISKRIGGAFGGKEWKAIIVALPTILAARKFQRPIRCMLDRDEDMLINGGRPSYLFEYNVGFDDRGKILASDFNIFTNGGYALECTALSLGKTMSHIDNAFSISNIRARGKVCKTNTASNTAMRGFGGPEAIFASLCIIDDISEYLKKDFVDIVTVNLYKDGDFTFYKQEVDGGLKRCFEECLKQAAFYERKKNVEQFNRENKYKKRGCAIIPSKFGVGLDTDVPHFCQAAALVNVYVDGSVLLHHGGVEIGQGLHTKLIQIATRVLEISADHIYTDTIATNIVPNCSPTVASLSSDLFGPAVIDACTKIKDRLKPLKEANPTGTWKDWISQAYSKKISLSATGFYSLHSNEFDHATKIGRMFDYFVCGAGCSEVEIDVLTGDHQVLSTDIVMDLGESLNPAIDIGQIEGAFMQGYGLFMMEESVYSPTGQLYTKGPGTYKIPGFADIPREFNVSLLKGTSNPRAVYSSKAVGEPPLGLANSVFFAIKDAIKAARTENGALTAFRLDAPATAEKIRMACLDNIIKKVPDLKEGTFTPWNVVP